jgi:hypothetical protein
LISDLVIWLMSTPGSCHDRPTLTTGKAKQFSPLQR